MSIKKYFKDKNIQFEKFLNYNYFKYFVCQLSVLLGTKNSKMIKLILKTAKALKAFFRLFRFLFYCASKLNVHVEEFKNNAFVILSRILFPPDQNCGSANAI